MNKTIFLLWLSGTTVLLLALYSAVLTRGNFEAEYAESNLVANQIRLESIQRAGKSLDIVLCGTSLTARLPTEAFSDVSKEKIVNLGIDGGSSLYSCERFLNSGKKTKMLFIEINGLFVDMAGNEAELDSAGTGLFEQRAKYLRSFQSRSRPVTLLYHGLKSQKDLRSRSVEAQSGMTTFSKVKAGIDIEVSTEYEKWSSLIDRLCSQAERVILFSIPDNRETDYQLQAFAATLDSSNENVGSLDLKAMLSDVDLSYTDGLHLVRQSAEQVAEIMGKGSLRPGAWAD